MIFATGVFMVIFSLIARMLLSATGCWHVHIYRWTDWFVVLPFYSGFAFIAYAFAVLCARYLP